MGVVLILSHAKDDTPALVIPHLQARQIDFVRFNTEDYPTTVKICFELADGVCGGKLIFRDREVDLEEITAIWNRRPHSPEIDPAITDPTIRKWSETEAHFALQYLWSMVQDRFWLNPIRPEHRIQDNKLVQLLAAHRVGLRTPPSLLSNDLEAIRQFWAALGVDLALKKVQTGVLEYPDGGVGLLHTTRLKRAETNETDVARLRFYPAFLQQYIQKATELRITVVGEKSFACEIPSQMHEWTQDDWRRQLFLTQLLPHKPYDLPEDIAKKCIVLVRELGLIFGAIDIAVTPDGEYVFFEVNPNGQWAWIERLTGLPIGEAIAEELAAHANKEVGPRGEASLRDDGYS